MEKIISTSKILMVAACFFAHGLVCGCFSQARAYSVDGKINIDFTEEARVESWSTFDDGTPNRDDSYTFTSSKMRLGVGAKSRLVEGYLQLHWTQFFGLPDDAMYGLGALYYGHNRAEYGGSEDIGYGAVSQAWLSVACPRYEDFRLKAGRFSYNSGLETGAKDPTILWLKQNRVSQRLIGMFEWSRVGRSFDGFQLSYDQPTWNITMAGMNPTPGGFYLRRDDPTANGFSVHDVDIGTIALSLKDSYIEGLDAQAFYYYYNDDRGLVEDPEVHSLGAHLLYATKAGPGTADLLFWGVYQWGSFGSAAQNLDHGAYATALEAGYKFTNAPWQPWLRVGYFYGSGDDDPDDGDHDTFFMMIPTLRIYAFTPFYNLMNTTDLFGQLILKPNKKVVVRTDVHRLSLTEENDFWYQGSGIMRPDIFGYTGIGSHIARGDDDLGTLCDISLFLNDLYKYKDLSIGLNLYYGHVFGDEVIEDRFPKDEDLDFFYAEGVLKF